MSELHDVLGIAQEVSSFTDGKSRTAHPVPMRDFPDFIAKLGFININDLWKNMIFVEGVEAVEKVLSVTFKDEPIEDVMGNINARNFQPLMDLIMQMNGIDFNKPKEGNEVEV